jgi:hypothetical protein
VLAAAAIAAAGGAGTYAVMAWTAEEHGRGTPIAHPSGTAPADSAVPPVSASRSKTAGPSRPRPSEGTAGGGRPSRPGQDPAPTGGGDQPGPGRPDPTPVPLGSPDPERYCARGGNFTSDYRSGEWYCKPDGGIGVDTHITMTQVCRSQYAPAAEARLDGDAGTPSDWECYVLR